MIDTPKPDLSEHEEESVPFDDVMQKLLEAKPASKQAKFKEQDAKPTQSSETDDEPV